MFFKVKKYSKLKLLAWTLYYVMPVLNATFRAFNIYVESSQLHNPYFIVHIQSEAWADQKRPTQARFRKFEMRDRVSPSH